MTTADHDFTRAQNDRGIVVRCDRCRHSGTLSAWDPPLLVCRQPDVMRAHRVTEDDRSIGIACNVARSALGRCGGDGRHYGVRA